MFERYMELLNEKGLKNIDVSRETGIPSSTFSDWKKGKSSPKQEKLQKIADFFDVQVDWLTGTSDFRTKQEWLKSLDTEENLGRIHNELDALEKFGIMPISRQKLPLIGEIACGEPIFANEDRESYIEAGTEIHADFCLKAKGDSMINARIFDGDIIFIRKQGTVDNGDIGAVIIDDTVTLKRVFYYPDDQKLVLQAENPKYEPFVYVGEELDHVHILGKAVAFQSDVI